MDWWVLELLTDGVLIGIAFWLGPLIKRFGKSYAADVFRANPRTGKSFIVLTDIAYYLIFAAYIMFTIRYSPAANWAQTVDANQLQHGPGVQIAVELGLDYVHGTLEAEDEPAENAAAAIPRRFALSTQRVSGGRRSVARRDSGSFVPNRDGDGRIPVGAPLRVVLVRSGTGGAYARGEAGERDRRAVPKSPVPDQRSRAGDGAEFQVALQREILIGDDSAGPKN